MSSLRFQEEGETSVKHSILILIVLSSLLLTGCAKTSTHVARTGPPLNDVEFAKEVFRLMAEGDETVMDMVDWEHLKMLGIDVGAMYPKSGDEARDRFARGFLKGYSNSFKSKGGSADNVSNWREQSRDASNTIVTADNAGGQHLAMTVTHIDGQQKVSTLELK
jgi:hypothetical protein